MAEREREINESPRRMGADEEIAFTIDFTNWGTPSGPAETLVDSDGTDVSSTSLSGSPSVNGDVVTTSKVKSLTAGESYIYKCKVTISGNAMSAWMKIICEQN